MHNILLVDDNVSILDVYKNLLINEGLNVTVAENCEEALNILGKQKFPIIITDMRFGYGVMDGFDFIKQIKKRNLESELIIITGYADTNMAIKAINLDICELIKKPCRKELLLAAIKKASDRLEEKKFSEKEVAFEKFDEDIIPHDKLATVKDVLATICHEIIQPLTGIMGYAELLGNEIQPTDLARDYIKKVKEQSDYMEKIINNIRNFSSRCNEKLERVSINDVIQCSYSSFEYQFKHNNIEFIKDLADDLPCIMANKVKLQQVFVNFFSNAQDAVNSKNQNWDKRITIKTNMSKSEKSIYFAIQDNGMGIDKKIQSSIFEPFMTTKKQNRGTGLGLFLCQNIVNEFAGKIGVKSKQGTGTTFCVAFPVAEEFVKQKKEADHKPSFVPSG